MIQSIKPAVSPSFSMGFLHCATWHFSLEIKLVLTLKAFLSVADIITHMIWYDAVYTRRVLWLCLDIKEVSSFFSFFASISVHFALRASGTLYKHALYLLPRQRFVHIIITSTASTAYLLPTWAICLSLSAVPNCIVTLRIPSCQTLVKPAVHLSRTAILKP